MTTSTYQPPASAPTSPAERIRAWLSSATTADLALRFSVVAVVVTAHHEPVAMAVIAGLAVVVLARDDLLRHPLTWLVGAAALTAWQLTRWYHLDNHVWLGTYWMAAVGLALTSPDRRRALRTSGRLLLGTVFLLAAAWKVATPEFRSGDFFHHALLGDDRFALVSSTVGGPDDPDAHHFRVARSLVLRPGEPVELPSSPGVRFTARAFTLWGLFIEVAIAVTWLAPLRGRAKVLRHVSLLAFAATTYVLVPVGGFGCLLAAIGLTQADDGRRVRTAYVVAFVALIAYGPLWKVVAAT